MNYEKKYKEAQKWIESIYSELSHEQQMEAEAFFPELKENEDERIREEIIATIHLYYGEPLEDEAKEMIAWLEKQGTPQDKGEISDGYHTFNELYYYRMLYNAAFFNMLPKEWVHKSKKHHDGEDCFGGGWFIVMANLPTGQISNHYELKNWDLFQIPEKEVADKWDGHTPQEAADRLHKYLLEKQGEKKASDKVLKIRQELYQSGYNDGYKHGCEDSKKQGEQKPAVTDFNAKDWYVSKVDGKIHDLTYNPTNKIEPKFKVGDYIVSDYCMGRVIEITNDAYLLDTGQGIPFSCEDKVHLWTIADANEGNILAGKIDGDNYILIFKTVKDGWIETYGHYYNAVDRFCVPSQLFCRSYQGTFAPATKEQRELLFQKMNEAGYEWNAEKKELKTVEKKPQRVVSAEAKEALYDKPTDNDMVEALRTEYEKGRADAIDEMQKTTWSEADSDFMYDTLSNLTELKDRYGKDYGNVGKCIDWLKSLKQRIGGKV